MLLEKDEKFRIVLGDCIETMMGLPEHCVDFVITSVPFPQMYAYTSLSNDVGNSEGLPEMKIHFSFLYKQLKRVLKPGRVALIHTMQIPRMKRTGGDGLYDFRGLNIRIGERAGLIYHYDWLLRHNPQAQALRTRSRELQFAGLEADRARSRGALGDYLIKFIAPGENAVPIDSKGEVSRNEWIEWAECCWSDIRETDTLNFAEARQPEDIRHLCAFPLRLVMKGIKLFTNPDEIVYDPFTGIGSSVYQAIKYGRRGFGTEIRPEYHALAIRNCNRALENRKQEQTDLFSLCTPTQEPK